MIGWAENIGIVVLVNEKVRNEARLARNDLDQRAGVA